MAIGVTVEIPKSQQLRIARLLSPNRMKWAEKEALNRTAGNIQKIALGAIAKEMGIPRTKLLQRGRKIAFSSTSSQKYGRVSKDRNATLRRLVTGVRMAGRPFNVVRFGGQVIYGPRSEATKVTAGRTPNKPRTLSAKQATQLAKAKKARKRRAAKYAKQRAKGLRGDSVPIGVTHKAWGRSQSAKGPIWQLKNSRGKPIVIRDGNTFRSYYGPGTANVAQYPRIRKILERATLKAFDRHFASRVRYAFSSASHVRV